MYRPAARYPIRYASTATTSTATTAEADTPQAEQTVGSGGASEEEAELQRLQALIKDKLAKQKQRLLEQLSPLPGEQTSGFKRRTRAQREAERTAKPAEATPAVSTADKADSQQQQQTGGSGQNEQPWQQLTSPLPLRKPTHLNSTVHASTSIPQPRRSSQPHTSTSPSHTAPTHQSTSRSNRPQPSTADTEAEEQQYHRGRLNDPNFNPERQAMLHDRNVRREEQKRVKVQRRLEREETERTARQGDELFHDVVSPRQKVRGKGIAGSAVLAKHQRHTKGVREGSERDEKERRLATTGSVEERMSRSVLAGGANAMSGARSVDAERDHHRRQLKYAERGERGSRQDWAGAGKPGRWEAREQRWQSGRKMGKRRRVGEEHVSPDRPRGYGVALHPHGRSVNKRDAPAPASPRTYTYSREKPKRSATRKDAAQSNDRFSWLSDMKQQASGVQQERQEREARRDRGRGRR